MTKTLSFALTLPLAFALGCFGAHGSDDDDSPIDAGPRPRDTGPGLHDIGPIPWDLGPERDAGPSTCSPQRADVSCGDAIHPSGVPFELPISIGGEDECYCGELVDCAVSLRPGRGGRPSAIELNTQLCVGDLLCDGCFPYIDGACRVPPLPGGEYPVWLNGELAFEVTVTEGDLERAPQQCTRVAASDALECGPVSWPAQDFEPSEVCHPESIFTGTRATITVVDTCASCGMQPGPCTVTVDETGVAPVLQVDTSRTYTACDVDCPAVCMHMEHECVVPGTLAPETSYQVIVDGVSFGTSIQVGSFDGGEICAGATIGG